MERLASSLPPGLMPTTQVSTHSGELGEALSLPEAVGEAGPVALVPVAAVHVAEADPREVGAAMLLDSSLSRHPSTSHLPLQRPLKATTSQVSFLLLDPS